MRRRVRRMSRGSERRRATSAPSSGPIRPRRRSSSIMSRALLECPETLIRMPTIELGKRSRRSKSEATSATVVVVCATSPRPGRQRSRGWQSGWLAWSRGTRIDPNVEVGCAKEARDQVLESATPAVGARRFSLKLLKLAEQRIAHRAGSLRRGPVSRARPAPRRSDQESPRAFLRLAGGALAFGQRRSFRRDLAGEAQSDAICSSSERGVILV